MAGTKGMRWEFSRSFELEYGARCADCGQKIEAGTRGKYRRKTSELVHDVCPEREDGEVLGLGIDGSAIGLRKGETICPKCFMTSCDCGKDI